MGRGMRCIERFSCECNGFNRYLIRLKRSFRELARFLGA